VLGAISVIILSSIGVAILISKILKEEHKPTSFGIKISFLAIIVALLMVPMVYPEKLNWSNNNIGIPNSLLHSASSFDISTNDWPDAMQWLKENTPKDATIAAWWDYGYWISTLSERKSLADNATVLDWQIRKLASMYMSTPDDAWKILMSDTETNVSSYYVTLPSDVHHPTRHLDGVFNEEQHRFQEFDRWKENYQLETTYDPDIIAKYSTLYDYWISEVYVLPPIITGLDADYVMVNLALRKLSEENQLDLYTIRQDGADETKAYWFMKIADLRVMDYYNPELTSYTDKFWNETLLGSLIPFTPVLYVDPNNPERQSETFKPGYVAIYVKNIKFPLGGQGPFELVYIPPSFERDATGPLTGPIIYKINKEYNTNQ
jgi:dolichyl-diphosphooligosaccharide--protein glycosyltransferase